MNVVVYRRPPERVTAWLHEAGLTVEAQTLLGPNDPLPSALLFARRQP